MEDGGTTTALYWRIVRQQRSAPCPSSLATLPRLRGPTLATCQLGEVASTPPMQKGAASEPSPANAHVVQGLGPAPFGQGLLADLQQDRATVAVLLAHDSHAGLVGDADVSLASAAAAGDGLYALDFVAASVVKDGVGQEDQSVRAGVGVMVLTGFPWTEYVRRFGVQSL